jgi:hypothetical protein
MKNEHNREDSQSFWLVRNSCYIRAGDYFAPGLDPDAIQEMKPI